MLGIHENDPLCYIQSTTAKPGATELRWVAELANYNLAIKHRSGKVNRNADSLSRKTSHTPETTYLEEAHVIRHFHADPTPTPLPHHVRDHLSAVVQHVWSEEVKAQPQRLPPTAPLAVITRSHADISLLQVDDPVINRVIQLLSTKTVSKAQLKGEGREVQILMTTRD